MGQESAGKRALNRLIKPTVHWRLTGRYSRA